MMEEPTSEMGAEETAAVTPEITPPILETDAGRTPRAARRGLHLDWLSRVLLAVVALTLTFNVGVETGQRLAPPLPIATPVVPASLPPEFATYLEAWQILRDNYVDPSALNPQTLVYGSIDGLVKAIGDEGHTRFLTPAEVAASQNSLNGTVAGIGAIMDGSSGTPVIQSVVPNGPADHAGLRSKDQVVAVDGQITAGQTLDIVIGKIRGEPGTVVRLTIVRESGSPFDISITRARVVVPAVNWTLIPGTTIADIRLEEFSKDASKQLAAAIAMAQTAGATGIVLDLRSNPGGYVDEAVGVASLFLADGAVFQQRNRAGVITKILVSDEVQSTELPLDVLIDTGTASASEIVAGALQDATRATIVGQTSFGTGTVLAQYVLPDGSALLVGTTEWLTRDGRQIWRHGIVPDIAVPTDPADRILTPAELAGLDSTALAKAGDATLLRAVADLIKRP